MSKRKVKVLVRRQVGFPSRNRQDILEEVKSEEIRENCICYDESHLIWETTPEELARLAEELKKAKPAEDLCVSSHKSQLSLRKPSENYYLGLEVRRDLTYYPEGVLTISPSRLATLANKLAGASWEKKDPDWDYGSDRKIVRSCIGNDLVTIVWTPPLDQNGFMQISMMVWNAWWIKTQRIFAQVIEAERKRRATRRRPQNLIQGRW